MTFLSTYIHIPCNTLMQVHLKIQTDSRYIYVTIMIFLLVCKNLEPLLFLFLFLVATATIYEEMKDSVRRNHLSITDIYIYIQNCVLKNNLVFIIMCLITIEFRLVALIEDNLQLLPSQTFSPPDAKLCNIM